MAIVPVSPTGYLSFNAERATECRVPGAKQKILFFSVLLRDRKNKFTAIDVDEHDPIALRNRAMIK